MNERIRASLRQRLFFGLVVVSLLYSMVIAWWTVRDSVNEVYEILDVQLAQTALALLRVTDPDEADFASVANTSTAPDLRDLFSQWPELPQRLAAGRGSVSSNPGGPQSSVHTQFEKSLRYQILNRQGEMILRSANAPMQVMTLRDGLSESTDADGLQWKYFGVWDRHGDFRIVVSENSGLRNRLVRSISLHVASPIALGLPVLFLLLWFSIRRGLNPLGKLTREIEARQPDSLLPIDELNVPQEVRPMVGALNSLLLRMSDSLDGERRFTAHAAHELRTPLAAIQAQAYVAETAKNETDRRMAIGQLQRCVRRGIRLVGQLLALARLDPHLSLPDAKPVQLRDVVEEACADLAPLALQRKQVLEFHADDDVPKVLGNADMLSMLVCNLIDNAIRYTPEGGNIHVRLVQGEQSTVLVEVADDGPGIAPEQRERVFDRFYRIAQSDQAGTGLGLAICRRIAELHAARIDLANGLSGKGVCVTIRLPALFSDIASVSKLAG